MKEFNQVCSACNLEFSTDPNKTDGIYESNSGSYLCHSCVSKGMTYCSTCKKIINKKEKPENLILFAQLIPFTDNPINVINKTIDSYKQFCSSNCYNIEMIDILTIPYNMILQENMLGFDSSSNNNKVEFANQSLNKLQSIKENLLNTISQ